MGEAKRRAQAREQLRVKIEQANLPRLSAAMRKLATAASSNFGSDCYGHAVISQEILRQVGVEAKLVVGYAAWRVGDGDTDVILHAPLPNMPPQPGGVAYHVWLEIGYHILDLTTYQLRTKAAHLDELDGGVTNVTWCPDYLFVPKKTISTIREVTQLHAGLYHYEQNPAVEAKIIQSTPIPDIEDVQAAWLLYQDQNLEVFGPNDVQSLRCMEKDYEADKWRQG